MDPGPDLEHHHHHHTGRRWLDVALGLSAIAISVISLFVAVHHGQTMEKMVAASTWPYVDFAFSTTNADGEEHGSLTLMNSGVGPAKIESFEIFYQGKPLANGRELLTTCCQAPGEPRPGFYSSTVTDRVLPARENIVLFIQGEPFTPAQSQRLRAILPKLTARICYCSVLQECWVRKTEAPRPEPVEACTPPKVPYHD